MSNDFKYAPGRPGFGTKGEDGSTGKQGLSMYFTNIDPLNDEDAILTRLNSNEYLWSGINTPLTHERVYVEGDLFMDSDGKMYEIIVIDDSTGELGFQFKHASLNMGFFTSSNIQTTKPSGLNNQYTRYYNMNMGPKYIIDNVYTNQESGYFNFPATLYGINVKEFARIEYSNVPYNVGELEINPFTAFLSSNIQDSNNNIALIRDVSTNTFRLGNVANDGSIRNVNFTFDVASLTQTKEASINTFTPNTVLGTILTNYEMQANSIFNGAININPDGGISHDMVDPSTIKIEWDLTKFSTDPLLSADLYIFRDLPAAGQYYDFEIHPHMLRPRMMHDINQDGSVNIFNLSFDTSYGYYLNFHTNTGWERRGNIKRFKTSPYPNIMLLPNNIIISPDEQTVENAFCVSSNVPWKVEYNMASNLIMTIEPSVGIAANDASLNVSIIENTNCLERELSFRIVPQEYSTWYTGATGIIEQSGVCEKVYINHAPGSSTCVSIGTEQYTTVTGTITISELISGNTYELNDIINTINISGIVLDEVISTSYFIKYKIDDDIVLEFDGSVTENIERIESDTLILNDIDGSPINIDYEMKISADHGVFGGSFPPGFMSYLSFVWDASNNFEKTSGGKPLYIITGTNNIISNEIALPCAL